MCEECSYAAAATIVTATIAATIAATNAMLLELRGHANTTRAVRNCMLHEQHTRLNDHNMLSQTTTDTDFDSAITITIHQSTPI
jgi:hypothetical protein